MNTEKLIAKHDFCNDRRLNNTRQLQFYLFVYLLPRPPERLTPSAYFGTVSMYPIPTHGTISWR